MYVLWIVVCPFVLFPLAVVFIFDMRVVIESLVSSNSSYPSYPIKRLIRVRDKGYDFELSIFGICCLSYYSDDLNQIGLIPVWFVFYIQLC